ncbi:MAG: outer membrane protein assembly factor BamD [Ignavibacteriaceae bacterium]|nr:outer membrane protein assembly factor BamD [Ignavibacteriaceae bacterium]NUM71749.1 outer membrane protein assembly factor BamD [Ignavibacteriaceae bacterium]
MHKKLYLLFTAAVLFMAGCSSSVDKTTMGPEERFNYAKAYYDDESYFEAAAEFESFILQYPGSVYADDAQYYLGMSRYHRGEYLLGAYEFSKLIRNTPTSEFVPECQFMLADCYYELSPHYSLDQKYTEKAIEEFQAFIDFFPLDKRVDDAEKKIKELNEKLALKSYEDGLIYEKMEYYTAALKYYTLVTEIYHDTRYAPMASYRKIVILNDKGRNNEALKEIDNFLSKYKDDSNYSSVERLKTAINNQ